MNRLGDSRLDGDLDAIALSGELVRAANFIKAIVIGIADAVPALDLPEAKYAVLRAAERELAAQGRSRDLVSGSLSAA